MWLLGAIVSVLAGLTTLHAQNLKCSSLAGGCNGAGKTREFAIRTAIERFEAKKVYGGENTPILFSSFLDGDFLAQISYSCSDGLVPPALTGSSMQSR
jgi:hypothetical protein